jgi:hypothetical protein
VAYKTKKKEKEWRKNHRALLRKYGREWHIKHREHKRMEGQLYQLRLALAKRGKLYCGWPDDGFRLEVKLGNDLIKRDQLRRYAWLEKNNLEHVKIRLSPGHQECFEGNYEDVCIKTFLNRICGRRKDYALTLWDKLLEKMGKI